MDNKVFRLISGHGEGGDEMLAGKFPLERKTGIRWLSGCVVRCGNTFCI